MSGTLALVGGAEFGPECFFDSRLFPPGSEVVLVPTAQAYEDPSACVAAATAHFEPLGVSVSALPVYTRGGTRPTNAWAARVRSAGSLYVAGGSAVHLPTPCSRRRSCSRRWSTRREGATVAVAAEAAAVLCSHMVDSRGGAFTVGLGLVTSMTVIPRFNRWSPEKLHRTVRLAPPDLVVVGIDEWTALARAADGVDRRGPGWGARVRGRRAMTIDALPHALNPDAGI